MSSAGTESGNSPRELNGRVAVVVGSGYGIGRAIVEELVDGGAVVVCADLDSRAEALAEELGAAGHSASFHYIDLRDAESVAQLFEDVVRDHGSIDILVNNAAAPRSTRSFVDLGVDEWDMNMSINARGTFLAMQQGARAMIAAGKGGRIVNIATVAAMRPFAERAHYGASKGVVISLMRSAALELAEHGITVNAVAPGPVDTEQSRAALAGGNSESDGDRLTQIFTGTPVGRIGEAADIARAVRFLSAPASDFITGVLFPVDGGMAIKS